MRRTFISLSLLLFVTFISNAGAQTVSCDITDPVPCKKIRVYNNNPPGGNTIYTFFESFIQEGGTKADLWMQAQFKVSDWDQNFISPRKFVTTRLRRAYIVIGNDDGIAPRHWVEITVPFYTQLLATTADNLGKIPDQYIDWWNSGRIVFFDSIAAYHSAKVTNALGPPAPPGGGLPPPPVHYLPGAAVPSCTSSDGKTCSVPLFENALQPLDGIPFQLQEYTFASAEGPPLDTTLPPPTRTKIDLTFVNYNVSSLDSVFLPVAMGPLTKAGDSVNVGVDPPVPVPYVGTKLSTEQFRKSLEQFSREGNNWPFYVPAYYDDMEHPGFPSSTAAACSLAPFPTDSTGTYNLPKIPGAFNVLTASYQGFEGPPIYPPVPPVLSSNPADYKSKYASNACTLPAPAPFVNPPHLGVDGKSFVDLWNKCTTSMTDASQSCKDVRTVAALFTNSYFNKACKQPQTPPFYIVMQAVYGWVPIVYQGCTGLDLKTDETSYQDAALAYCRLQYNYVTLPASQKAYIFNPSTALIHAPYTTGTGGGLASSAYAFSIDDKLSFKSVVADGVILAIAGTNGLEFDKKAGQTAPVPTPIPTTAQEIEDHCKVD
jgi:hypothetical protein